ncbi:MAG: hypothetical protein OXG68_13790, partial [Chloroflexi bacterium]|nr:hypothetical protein [Chloroflexota bacterium]
MLRMIKIGQAVAFRNPPHVQTDLFHRASAIGEYQRLSGVVFSFSRSIMESRDNASLRMFRSLAKVSSSSAFWASAWALRGCCLYALEPVPSRQDGFLQLSGCIQSTDQIYLSWLDLYNWFS